MSKEIPPELHGALRRLGDITDTHTEKVGFIQDRWATLRRTEPADPDAVRAAAERDDASPELKAVAAAVRGGKTTWAGAVNGDADHLPELQAFYEAQRKRITERLREAREPSAATEPRRVRAEPDDHDFRDAAVFETW